MTDVGRPSQRKSRSPIYRAEGTDAVDIFPRKVRPVTDLSMEQAVNTQSLTDRIEFG
jgi:hypothetical protein